ncbi:MAG: phosphoadenylyl-sulfate reductase [Cyclobacteriaceae bacterium]|nr:phosphoadenylyl-sulfate reductase [Cyclobacteriaceae bacterium]
MSIERIKQIIDAYTKEGKTLFTTSSFQTHSIVLLHILHKIVPDIPVYFLDTGYHFRETLKFRDEITERFSLNTINLSSGIPQSLLFNEYGKPYHQSEPDLCCKINKVNPLVPVLEFFDIWVNGVRADQTFHRKSLSEVQDSGQGYMRYHPVLDWDSQMIEAYRKEFDLPEHPLDAKGYRSIGCKTCTVQYIEGTDERDSRWAGTNKKECGLNTELI